MVVLQAEQQLSVVILQAGAAEVDCGAVARQRGIGLAAGGRQQGLLVVLQGGAAVVDCITAGRAVEVNYGAAGRGSSC
jgi:hypothetical protein